MGKSKMSNHAASKGRLQLLEDQLSAARGHGLSAEKLQAETDFMSYVKLLKGFAQRYCVMIAVCDTPVGPFTTREATGALKSIGLNVDLFQKYRCPYAALIDAGILIFEQICLETSEIIDQKIHLGEDEIELISVGYNAPIAPKETCIKINNKVRSLGGRGLKIIVYDKVTKTILDTVAFDTYAETTPCIRPNMDFQMLRKFAAMHPDVSVVCYQFPVFPTASLSADERFIKEHNIGRGIIISNLDQPLSTLRYYFDTKGIEEVLSTPKSYHDVNGVRRFEETRGKYVNTIGGHRVTTCQPNDSRRTVFLAGGCQVFGIGSDDDRTIASYLQRLFNEKLPDSRIIVQNYGFFLTELDRRDDDSFKILNALPVKPGDIVLYPGSIDEQDKYLQHSINLSRAAEHPRSYEVFFDTGHFTPDGNRLIAEGLFQGLLDTGLLQSAAQDKPEPARPVSDSYGFDGGQSNELAEYKSILVNWYQEMFGVTMGAVVMNCNPFTLGHRYLIEKALEQCGFLAIFAVQEDQSDFPFEDRLRLIDEGVADLKNVVVIPSGRFVLSSLTFSEYFNKSELQDREIDSSLDVTVFAREIAPCLNITKRFAGEEPFDRVTRQYNETMRKILPEYGIEFIEIPRLETGGTAVSASRVRSLLKAGDLAAVRPLVPESTFRYLRARRDGGAGEN